VASNIAVLIELSIDFVSNVGRRNSLRFHNVTITKEELHKTDDKIVDICEQHLKIDITSDDINRSHTNSGFKIAFFMTIVKSND
jgi:hypothetical protein